MGWNSKYLLYSPFSATVVGLLFTVRSLGHNVGSWGRPLVRGRGSVDSKVSLGLVDAKSRLGSNCLRLSLGGPQINVWSLPDLLDLRSVVMGLRGLCPGLTSGEVNLRALVGELRFELRDVGSSELVGERRAVDTELAAS